MYTLSYRVCFKLIMTHPVTVIYLVMSILFIYLFIERTD